MTNAERLMLAADRYQQYTRQIEAIALLKATIEKNPAIVQTFPELRQVVELVAA